ncbi:nuclear prelamin A recognition factor-like protein [Heterostelium album PN500]|uniref:Nuclear prelamin A recognition factor-like protein n=1 Tax=Heterostelium pallidum (strain ATCC 26659 / Pp 5 / PN500) TaxID=670386 RepID=D3BII7_HETP5|nr:nuclear prelamin A recognition factor-like protein [Heterostelium album PN500]EFA78611.1 nuclear prelamin A recognition factor-like protein [Heterostelium album PN500]|eukprot:XP_020430735.1 nuclear prelamin A recognition factor-like protein [Heterostelium album PN500]
MSDKFSSILKLTELDDFITPSQECIKPVEISKSKKSTKVDIDKDGSYVEIDEFGEKTKLEKATITLNDCLACSGCITSAESVLITAQSITEFQNVLNANTSSTTAVAIAKKTIVISISPQSRASIAAHFNLPIKIVQRKLEILFKRILNCDYVFDVSFGREFSLLESAAEFVARHRKQLENAPLPMLCSACPGWICYAEKSHGEYILPYISTTKSPQQIMGTLVKYYLGEKFLNKNSRDVDCVLSSSEVLDLLKEKSIDFVGLEDKEEEIDPQQQMFRYLDSETGSPYGVEGSTGGYFEFLYRYAAKELFGVEVKEIEYQVGRNTDFKEASLVVDGKKVMTFAKAYGFRNIQNVVRKIKIGKLPYDFVEVMACPSGCINGGGQIKAGSESLRDQKVLIQQAEDRYNEQQLLQPQQDQQINEIYKQWLNGLN